MKVKSSLILLLFLVSAVVEAAERLPTIFRPLPEHRGLDLRHNDNPQTKNREGGPPAPMPRRPHPKVGKILELKRRLHEGKQGLPMRQYSMCESCVLSFYLTRKMFGPSQHSNAGLAGSNRKSNRIGSISPTTNTGHATPTMALPADNWNILTVDCVYIIAQFGMNQLEADCRYYRPCIVSLGCCLLV